MEKTNKPLGQWWEDMEYKEGWHCHTKLEDGSYLKGCVFIGDMPIDDGMGGGVIIGDVPAENITQALRPSELGKDEDK